MAKRPTSGTLSELEGAILAIVWRDGPVTPYALRKLARESRSPHLSTSAGSVYPLVTRLEKRGLITGEPSSTGKREGVVYRITRAGVADLRAWIARPGGEVASGALVDPIRTRLIFISALPVGQRRGVIADLIAALEQDIVDLKARQNEFESLDPFERVAWRGDLLVQRARLKWLREVALELPQ